MNQTVKPSPLGRGLSALFGDADASYAPKAAVAPAPAAVADKVPTQLAITWLQPGGFQPRRHFDEDKLRELAESIKAVGILEPLVVRPVEGAKDSYEIIAGERRWRAAQMAGLHKVPIIVRKLGDREALEFGLIENVQRQDLNPLEEAEGYKRLIDEFKHSRDGLARIIGKSGAHIANMLRVLAMPQPVRQMIERGDLSVSHARSIITAPDPVKLAETIVKKGLSVRQVEELIRREQETKKNADPAKAKAKQQTEFAVDALEKDLQRAIGFKVKIATRGRAGTFTIFYEDLEQLDLIIKRMKGF